MNVALSDGIKIQQAQVSGVKLPIFVVTKGADRTPSILVYSAGDVLFAHTLTNGVPAAKGVELDADDALARLISLV